MIPKLTHLSGAFLCTLLLTNCGGGGGGFADGGGSTPTQPGDSSLVALGSAEFPNGTITAGVESSAHPGSNIFRVVVPSTYPPLSSVQIGWAVGAGDATVSPARTTPTSPGQYRIGLTLPGTIPAQTRLFVRLTHVDGAVVESGIEDFILPR